MNVDTIREICLSFPGTIESVKWEHDLAFTIFDKMFCVTSFDDPFKASLKVPDESFDELCSRKGFEPAPYLARAKWVLMSNESGLSKEEWTELAKRSYDLIAAKLTKKQRSQLENS